MKVIEVGFCCVAEDIQFIERQQHSCQDTLVEYISASMPDTPILQNGCGE